MNTRNVLWRSANCAACADWVSSKSLGLTTKHTKDTKFGKEGYSFCFLSFVILVSLVVKLYLYSRSQRHCG